MTRDTELRLQELEQATRQTPPKKNFIESYHANLRAYVQTILQGDEAIKHSHGPRLYRDFLIATERGNPDTLRIYLDAGIDVNYQDPKTGQTALHVLAAAQARQAIRVLLASGKCDFLIRDKRGRLASELAYMFGEDPALARLLGNKERKQAEAQGIKLTRRPVS